MKIFFAGSIRGGRSMLLTYRLIVAMLKRLGHIIVSEHVASEKLEEAEAKLADEEIFRSDISFIDECECLMAEVTMPSTGVGFEICYALSRGKRVVCVYKEGTNVSAMVLGNRRVTTMPYVNVEDLESNLIVYFKNRTANSGF